MLGATAGYQTMTKNDMRFLEKIVVASYVCDFGNIVINSSKKRTFKIVNYSTVLPLEFVFESKYFKSAGFSINPERVKIAINDSQTITITYQTKKNNNTIGRIKPILLPIDVKHGPRYIIELIANITIPDIRIENDTDVFDFGRVLIGQRKTLFLRFINEKEVVCEWNLSTRQDITSSGGDKEGKFILNPTSGVIVSQHKELVQVMFIPSAEKVFSHKFTIAIKENSSPKVINVKGIGTTINLEFIPMEINIGPVLPYEKAAYGIIQVVNNSDYNTEVVSLDFDEGIYKEEENLMKYSEFESQDTLFFPIREPGAIFWDFVTNSNVKRAKKEELEKRLIECVNEDERIGLNKQLEEFKDEGKLVEYPKKVEEKNMHHLIFWGPQGTGKTFIVKALAKEHKRCIVNMNELLEWNLNQKTKAYESALKFLEERAKDLENVKADREKLFKKAGKKAKQKEEEMGPLNEAPYLYLSEEILEDLLLERVKHPECNAGVIFDHIAAKEYPNELIGIKIIIKALKHHTVQLVLLEPQIDQNGLEIDKIIEWENMDKVFEAKAPVIKKKQAVKGGTAEKTVQNNRKKVVKKTKESEESKEKEEIVNEPVLFEIFSPKGFETNEEKLVWEALKQEIIDLMLVQLKETMKEHLEIPRRIKSLFFSLFLFYYL